MTKGVLIAVLKNILGTITFKFFGEVLPVYLWSVPDTLDPRKGFSNDNYEIGLAQRLPILRISRSAVPLAL